MLTERLPQRSAHGAHALHLWCFWEIYNLAVAKQVFHMVVHAEDEAPDMDLGAIGVQEGGESILLAFKARPCRAVS